MNIMKNEFVPKPKKLRFRGQKCSKSNLLGYHTVSRGLPFPPSAAFLGLGESFDMNQPCSTSSRLASTTYNEVTSEESFVRTFQTNVSRETNDDNSEQFDDCPKAGHGTDTPTDFEGLMSSFNIFGETTMTGDNFNFGRLQKTLGSDTSDSDEDVLDIRRLPVGTISSFDNTSEETSRRTSGSNAFSFDDLRQDFRTIHVTPTSSSTAHWCRPTSSSAKSSNKSSSRSYERTPGSRSMRSTPKTSGSGRMTSSDSETGSYILAITEGRGHARGEVGIAAIDTRRPHLILCQISDNQRYIHSLTKMSVFNFVEIIMPNTFIDGSSVSKLYTDVREYFPHVEIMSVQRRHFSESAGLELINQYCSPESESIMVLLRDKFYALSAASALIKYVEFSQNIMFAPRSVKVEYQGTEDSMIIDMNTANRLELVISKFDAESLTNNTLLGVLKHCHTKGGVRLLRANILQPPCSLSKIETRLDCVTELIQKPLLFFALESAISNFTSVENLLTLCMHEPQQDGIKAAEFQLKYVLLLKTILEHLPTLGTALAEGMCDFYAEVREVRFDFLAERCLNDMMRCDGRKYNLENVELENLCDVRYKIILDRILEVVPENVRATKGSLSAHLHSCFAIKTGVNGLLDIAKKTYCEIVQEIWDLINSLRDKHNLPLKMSFSAPRGFHIQYTPDRKMKVPDLSKEFILVQKSRSTYYFYTNELVSLDRRAHQVLNEVKIMTNVILYELLNDIRQNIGCLFNLCEYVAEIDVIVTFAHIGSGENFVRPKFGDVLNVIESRHPILDVIHEGKIISNDIFAEKEKNFSIITGPNQSGKSIYIGQIALLQIMAQIGCYVPAKEATFRIADRLFSRMGCDESIESNASTLIAEMREMEYLQQNLTANSLVVIDELCRGTSVEEGTSLAFTICEELLDSTAFIFVTTHYMFLTKLEEMYYNVANYHFESHLVKTEGGMSLRFTHKKLPGVTKAEQYGLQIAEKTSFPKDILATARKIAEKLMLERKPLPEVDGLAPRYRLSQQFFNELSEANPDQIAETKLRYRTMLLNLRPLNEYCARLEENREGEHKNLDSPMNSSRIESESNDVKKTYSHERIGKRKRNGSTTEMICKRIKRKYRVLMSRKLCIQRVLQKIDEEAVNSTGC